MPFVQYCSTPSWQDAHSRQESTKQLAVERQGSEVVGPAQRRLRRATIEAGHRAAHGTDMSDDFVAGHHRENAATPLAAGLVDVRMAHAAVGNLDLHIVRTGCAPFDGPGSKRGAGAGRSIGGCTQV